MPAVAARMLLVVSIASLLSAGALVNDAWAAGAPAAAGAGPEAAPPSAPAPGAPTSAPAVATRLLSGPPSFLLDGTRPLVATISGPVAADSPVPTLRPAVAGSWKVSQDSEVFTPASTLLPCTTYTLTVSADTLAVGQKPLGRRRELELHVACPPLLALQEDLAHLGYLPASLRALHHAHLPGHGETRRQAAVEAFNPPSAALLPDPSDAPQVHAGQLDAVTRGALIVFQSDHAIEATGEVNQSTWEALLSAQSDYRRDRRPYTWVTVSESLPETLEVHEGDRVALSSPANTGVSGAETELGVFPIFSRLLSTTMTGTDPDGVHYSVPDVPWVNYFNGGDAVHGYPRASYGSPQSNGCVELPIETAHEVFGMLAIGDLVDVYG